MTETCRRKDTANRHLLHHANMLCLTQQLATICVAGQLVYRWSLSRGLSSRRKFRWPQARL